MQLELIDEENFFQINIALELWNLFKTQYFNNSLQKKICEFYAQYPQDSIEKNNLLQSNKNQKNIKNNENTNYQEYYQKPDFMHFLNSSTKPTNTENLQIQDKNSLTNLANELSFYLRFLANYTTWHYGNTKLHNKELFIEVIFITQEEMQKANNQYMQKDYATDVLSFPLQIHEISQLQCLGSVIINMHEVCIKAKLHYHNIYAEISLLFIHAMLHILGYDHEKDSGEHRKIEHEILCSFGLPSSLIERTYRE